MSIYTDFAPTRLYIKRHPKTGLLYFGKTTKADNVHHYPGSGVYWKSHLKVHGTRGVETLWVSDWFFDPENLMDFALFFSEFHDIVKSDKWANLTPENGLDGCLPRHLLSEETLKKMSQSRMGKAGPVHTEEAKKRIGDARRGKPRSEEVKALLRAANLGKKASDETKAKCAKAQTGRTHSEETKAKMRASATGKVFTEEHRRRISEAKKKKT